MDVRNTLEVLELAHAPIKDTIAAYEDGSFTFDDIAKYSDLLEKGKAAVEGITLVPEEIKDIDAGEVVQLVSKAVEIGRDSYKLALMLMKK